VGINIDLRWCVSIFLVLTVGSVLLIEFRKYHNAESYDWPAGIREDTSCVSLDRAVVRGD
jgi:hypothetical protein